MLVASNTAEDDVVLLSTLESVDARDLDLFVQILLQGAVVLHVGHDIRSLAFVGSDDTYLMRQHACFEEFGDNLFDVARFGSGGERTRR
jgi:hypothetical protein